MKTKSLLNAKKITKYWKDQTPPNLLALRSQKQKFTDPYFPPNQNSITSRDSKGNFIDSVLGPEMLEEMEEENPGSSTRLIWKRATEILPKWEVFEGKIEFNDVNQGSLGDCYFLSAITALTEFPYLISEKFRTVKFNIEGYYEMIFFFYFEWQIVFVDDYFPYDPNNKNWAYALPHKNELWAMLIEKAWAKLNGGYSNAIGGIVSEPISCLTGFPTDYIVHNDYENDELFEKIENANKEGTIMSSASKGDEDIEKKGLIMGHAYTLMKAKAWRERQLYLIQLRNPWGEKEWTGNWSDNSNKWTDEYKKFFGYVNSDDGIFWIDIEDYMSNFEATYICYLLYESIIKSYYFEYEKYFEKPVIFNLHILEKAKTSICILFKNWRFNRDTHNVIHPFSLILAKYNKDKEIEKVYCKWSSVDDIELIETLEPGFYLLWGYSPIEGVVNDKKFKFTIQISCIKNFECEFLGVDEDFLLIQHILLENYKITGANNINTSKDYFLGNDKNLNKGGLNTLLLYNKSESWLEITATPKNLKNVLLFPPYRGMNSIKITIPPKQSAAIIGIRLSNKATSFSYAFQLSMHNEKKPIPKEESFDDFLKTEISNTDHETIRTNRRKFVPMTVAKSEVPDLDSSKFFPAEVIRKNTTRIEKITLDSLKKEYPKEFEKLFNCFKEENNKKLTWEKIPTEDGIYLGQIDEKGNFQGLGILIWKNGTKFLGNFKQHKMEGLGIILDDKDNLIYEGEFSQGKKNGTGKLYFSENEFYQGTFVNDIIEGKGIYQFKNGDVWEGTFKNNCKHGVGIMTYKATNKKYLVKFDMDNYMGGKILEDEIKKELEKTKEEIKKVKEEMEKKKGLTFNVGTFKKFLSNNFENILEKLYDKRQNIKSSILVQPAEEIKETPEQKKHRIFLENIEKFKKTEPFMIEQFLNLRPINNFEEDLIFVENQKGIKYLGGISNGLKKGRGGLFDGNIYHFGYFNNDKPAGYFLKYGKDKKIIFQGYLDQNYHIVKEGKIYFPNGDKYIGSFQNDQLHGWGTYYFSKGDSWTGPFYNGKFHGVGKYFYENGLLTEYITYNQNKVVGRNNLQREDYSSPGSEKFFMNVKNYYPGVYEHLLIIPPYREAKSDLRWELYKFNEGNIYIGQLSSDNAFCGRCCFIYKDSPITYYVGYIRNQEFNGEGAYYDKDWNVVYQGKFERNKRTGFGTAVQNDKSVYYGEFSNDLPNGDGVYYFPNGSRFEGHFINGEKNDKGYLINENNTTKQEIIYKNGNVIEQGDIEECNKASYQKKIHKEFEELYKKYPIYVKMFMKLKPTKDTLVLVRGIKEDIDGLYIGEMNSIGFKHGRGVLLSPHGKTFYVGYFNNNMKEGHGIIYYEQNKPKYIGNFKRNKLCGKGRFYYTNGEKLEGEFNQVGEGKGIYTFADGASWKGNFYAWTLHGEGEYFSKDGVSYGIKKYHLNNYIG